MPQVLDARLTVRCTIAEREAWHRFANARSADLSTLTRTALNNLSGVYNPPRLDLFTDDDLRHWTNQTADGVRRRRRPPPTVTTALLIIAVLLFVLGADEAVAACHRYVCP